MPRRQGGELEPTAEEEGVGAGHERVDSLANERRECGIDLQAVARLNNFDLDPEGGSRGRHVFADIRSIRIARVDQ